MNSQNQCILISLKRISLPLWIQQSLAHNLILISSKSWEHFRFSSFQIYERNHFALAIGQHKIKDDDIINFYPYNIHRITLLILYHQEKSKESTFSS